jgi:hypothetical protein
MNRERQIRAAVKLLGRGLEEIELALVAIEYENNQRALGKEQQAKKFKRALRTMLSALRRARTARDRLPWDIQTFEFVELENYEERCEQLLAAAPTAKPKRDEFKKRLAVREAQELLRVHGYKPVTTRKGKWCRLAAILYGNLSANLYPYCCELKKKEKGPSRVKK